MREREGLGPRVRRVREEKSIREELRTLHY